jgi:glutamine---fructose-6-phosphate transaminase (isomerizing)
VTWDLEAIEKGGFEHFMLKEIFEQPRSLEDVLRGRLLEEEGSARLGGITLSDADLQKIDRIVITACGTSWHSALIGEYMLEDLARIPTKVEYASEFRYKNPVVDERTLVIVISQSGETADTLAALREAKRRGATVMGIVNTWGARSPARPTSACTSTPGPRSGWPPPRPSRARWRPSRSSRSTWRGGGTCRSSRGERSWRRFGRFRRRWPGSSSRTTPSASWPSVYQDAPNVLYLGRGYQFPVALEGALKLKEVSYIHAEGYPAAEMKHGPIALIDEHMPVVFLAPRDGVYHKVVSNIEEVKARDGQVIAVVNNGAGELVGKVDHFIRCPRRTRPSCRS